MNTRTARILAASAAALILIVIGVVVANRSASPTSVSPSLDSATQPAAPASQPSGATGQPASYAISSDQAGTIALTSAPGATITGAPMLVTYQGAVVYEVTLDMGMVYVDANSGQVVANTAAVSATTSGGQGGEGHEGGEGGEDEDDDD